MNTDLNYRKILLFFLRFLYTENTSSVKEVFTMKIQELQERNAQVENVTIVICGNL